MNNNIGYEYGKIGAVIVVFFPDMSRLCELINSLLGQSCRVLVFNNGGLVIDELLSEVIVLGNGSNKGLGYAINRALNYFYTHGYGPIFTFDQDTILSSEFVTQMYQVYNSLLESEVCVAAIAPSIVDARNVNYKYKLMLVDKYSKSVCGCRSVYAALQSGMLINLSVWRKNKFNEDLFIEYVDAEWCYRVIEKGKFIYQTEKTTMNHEVSDDYPRRFLSISLLTYPSLRNYYFLRNSVYLLTRKYVPLVVKARILSGIMNRVVASVINGKDPIRGFVYFYRGIADALRGRYGKYGYNKI